MTAPKSNMNCVTFDCTDCHGKGYVDLFRGNPPERETIRCPGQGIVKFNVRKEKLDLDLVSQDVQIHEMFMYGYTFPEMADLMYIEPNGTQKLQRYVSMRRKLEPGRWPPRKPGRRYKPKCSICESEGLKEDTGFICTPCEQKLGSPA